MGRLVGLKWLLLVLLVSSSDLLAASAGADTRVALLIGNARYSSVPSLTNPPRDVAALASAFRDAGFDRVETASDLDRLSMLRTLQDFSGTAAKADIAVIYYSGHGLELGGENYVVPVDANLASDEVVEDEAVSVDRVLRSVARATKLRLLILDACRNDPFISRMTSTGRQRAVARGLARVEPSQSQTLVAYAAAAGATALDGDGGNSPFAAALLKHLFEPGRDVRLALGAVRDDVMAATGQRQEPYTTGALGGEVTSLKRTSLPTQPTPALTSVAVDVPPPAFPVATAQCASAEQNYVAAAAIGTVEAFRQHALKYSTCAYAAAARFQADRLEMAMAEAKHPPGDADADKSVVRPTSPSASSESALLDKSDGSGGDNLALRCHRLAARPNNEWHLPVPGVPFTALDSAKAIPACRAAVATQESDAALQYSLGRALRKNGEYRDAMVAFKRSTDLGSIDAPSMIGILYANGFGVTQNYEEAVVWYRKSADRGDPVAMNNLGAAYRDGKGIERNSADAVRWFVRAADLGEPLAMNNLGVAYREGVGVKKSNLLALRWFNKAADVGEPLAMNNLGIAFRDRNGVNRDYVKAARWFAKAVELGEPLAMINLADALEGGRGVPQDTRKALELYYRAASMGVEEGRRNYARLADTLQRGQP